MTVVTAIQSGNWSSESTWDTNTVPSTLDTVIIDAAYTVIYDISTPISSDVRSGVATGTTTGSLIVPQNATVLSGVVYDNGTTGTLSVASQLSVDGIALDVTAIKAQTDQINFKTISVTEYTGDQYWVNVSLLLHMNGSDLSTIFTDEAGHTVSVYGDAKITTSNSKYGGSSGTFDGSGDYVGITADSSLNLVSGDWTIETWIYIPALPSSNMYIYDKDGVSDSSYPQYSSSITAAGKISTFLGNGNGVSPSGQNFLSNGTISINTWTHLAWVRSGNNLILFIDGIQDYLAAITATMHEGNKPFYIGFSTGQPSTSNLKGLIDDFRITKGVARYISNFTPPSEELAGAGTNNTYDQTRVIAYGTGGTGGTCDLTVVEAGIARISSSLTTVGSNVTAVKAKTDQITFTASGIVADSGTTGGTDYTSRFDTIDGEVLAVKTQTDKLTFLEVDAGDSDPDWNSVGFLTHFDDVGLSTFNDETGKTITINGTASVVSIVKDIGVGSLYCAGPSSYGSASVAYDTSIDIASSDFTVELSCAFMELSSGGTRLLAASGGSAAWNSTSGIHWLIQGVLGGYMQIQFYDGGSSSIPVMGTSILETKRWYKVAICKSGTTVYLFLDGILETTTTVSNSRPSGNPSLGFGWIPGESISSGSLLNGFIDEVRITKGLARYTANYAISTREFPNTLTGTTYYQVATNATGGTGGTCDLTAVESSLSTISSSVTAVKTKTDQLTFDTVSVTEYLGGDPSWDSVSLLLHGNGTNGSTTIVDEAGRIGTVFGNTQISTTQSKYGGASIKFDGTGDYISYNGTGLVDFGTSDFTIEFWIFPSVTTNGMLILDARPSDSQNAEVTVAMDYNGTGKINWYTSSAFKINSASSISTGVWSHIAFSRASGKLRLFINGVLDSSVTDNTTYVSNTNVFVGANSYSPGSDSFNGYLDDLRVTHGVARYIDSFTPPAAELPGGGTSITYDQSQVVASGTSGGGTCDLTTVNNTLSIINGNVVSNGTNINAIKAKTDQLTFTASGVVADAGTIGGSGTVDLSPVQTVVDAIKLKTDKLAFSDIPNMIPDPTNDTHWNNVVLAMHMNGADMSTLFTDEKGKDVTRIGNTVIETSQSKFGGSSAYFDGSSGLSVSDPNDFNIGLANFTIEFWFYKISGSSQTYQRLIQFGPNGGSPAGNNGLWVLANRATANECLPFVDTYSGAYSSPTGWGTQPTQDAWHHLAVVRESDVWTIYIDGAVYATGTLAGYSISKTDVYIGQNSTGGERFNGYIDDIRITKGVARYTAPFTAPTTSFNTYSLIQDGIITAIDSNVISGTVVSDGGTSGSCDLTNVEAGITAIKAKTDQLLFSSGKVVADASVVDYTSQLSAITSTVNAISDAVDLIDAVTSKIAFEAVYSEGDPNLAQVIFKAEFNGTNGSTTINADTGQIGTNQGSPSLNTAYARTGTSSVALSGSIVSYGDISSLNLGANDFTIEFSVNFSSIVSTAGDYAGVVGKRASNGDFSWICYVTEGKINFLTSGTNAVSIAHPTTLSPATWYDVAISRTGDILKFYVNGVLSQVSCTGMNMTTTTAPFFIGRFSYDISSYHMFGYLDRLRITVGTGRYNSVAPVSPPVSEYPTTLNGIAQSYKVVANCDSGTTIPTDLTDRLTDLRNRINAIHFIVKDE